MESSTLEMDPLFHHLVKDALGNAIHDVTRDFSSKAQYVTDPGVAFSRSQKLPPDVLIHYIISLGGDRSQNELLDFFDSSPFTPFQSAASQRRSQLKPKAMEDTFAAFNRNIEAFFPKSSVKYRFFAVDGSTLTFKSFPQFDKEGMYYSKDKSGKGYYSMHINALYDLQRKIYTDCIIQPIHGTGEQRAFCDMVDRAKLDHDKRYVFIGDRGYASLNNAAHVMEKGQYFLFRAKDIESQGLLQSLNLPQEGSFDKVVSLAVVRTTKDIPFSAEQKKYITKNVAFDYLENKAPFAYEMRFRVVRYKLDDNSYECVMTNLPADEFPLSCFKALYFDRWKIEVSFRDLKYTNGLTKVHAYKPENVKQEVWGTLIYYNFTSILINHIGTPKKGTKHEHRRNFGTAAHEVRKFLRTPFGTANDTLMTSISRFTFPYRKDRKYGRDFTPRRPPDCIYRSA